MPARRPLRVGCVQLDPTPQRTSRRTPSENAARVRELLQEHRVERLDLLVLPEMSLTGYRFDDIGDIDSVLECASPGNWSASTSRVTLELASELSLRYRCYVLAGFPEDARDRVTEGRELDWLTSKTASPTYDARDSETTPQLNTTTRLYNSAILTDRNGQERHVFRKHFLYKDDKTWASEGAGFQYVDIDDLGRICVGICMDLNPYEFKSPFEAFELATFAAKHKVDILAMPTNWMMPEDGLDQPAALPSSSTINYWALRCLPLFEGDFAQDGHTTTFIAANRCGSEKDSTFAGSSSILQLQKGQQPKLSGWLGRNQDGVIVCEMPGGLNTT